MSGSKLVDAINEATAADVIFHDIEMQNASDVGSPASIVAIMQHLQQFGYQLDVAEIPGRQMIECGGLRLPIGEDVIVNQRARLGQPIAHTVLLTIDMKCNVTQIQAAQANPPTL